ncbi:unnamed protein product [Gadus morhua 'NCC']
MALLSRHETRGSESTVPQRPDPEEDLLAPEEDLLAPEEDLLAPEEDLLAARPRPRRRRRRSMSQPPSFGRAPGERWRTGGPRLYVYLQTLKMLPNIPHTHYSKLNTAAAVVR